MPALVNRVICALVFVWTVQCGAFAQTNAPARYRLGTIPDQTVWEGSARSILIYSDGGGGALSVSALPQPKGPLTLAPYEETSDWLFVYVPDAEDLCPFDVTVTASPNVSQTFTLTPQPTLPPETAAFGTDQHTQPMISTAEVSVFEAPAYPPRRLNYGVTDARDVRVAGDTIVLEAGHTNRLYEAYCDGNRRDIGSLEIMADTVIVRDELRMKQTDVTIWARELIFENEGSLTTTPEERLQSAGVDDNGGLQGVDGLPAGNITLNISRIIDRGAGVVLLDAKGGRGQPGGPGRHGEKGSSVETVWSSFRFSDSGIGKTHYPDEGYYITYWWYTLAGITADEGGTKTWPGDGTSAKPSGKPGKGEPVDRSNRVSRYSCRI